MPVIKGGIVHEFEIVSVAEEENATKSGNNLVIKVKTTAPLTSTKNDEISVGYPLTNYISLTPAVGRVDKKDYDEASIRRSLAQFLEAVEGKKTSLHPLSRFSGMRIMCKVTVRPGNDRYPNESNNISFVKRA